MLRVSLIALLAAAATSAVAAAPVSAATVSCNAGQYQLLHGENPTIEALKAHNLPRKTDGYAPRCLVAEAIVGKIQFRFGRSGKLPEKVWIYGARWNGGRWRCSYPETRGVCRKIGKPQRRVTMDLATPG
jgi:hypothetical protein